MAVLKAITQRGAVGDESPLTPGRAFELLADGEVVYAVDENGEVVISQGGGALKESNWIQITNDEMLNLADVSKELIPALASGFFQVLHFVLYTNIVGAYTGTPAPAYGLVVEGAVNSQRLCDEIINFYNMIGTTGVYVLTSEIDKSDNYFNNGVGQTGAPEAIQLTNVGANLGGGDPANLIYVKLWYIEVTLP